MQGADSGFRLRPLPRPLTSESAEQLAAFVVGKNELRSSGRPVHAYGLSVNPVGAYYVPPPFA